MAKKGNTLGSWAFLVGIAIAVLFGLSVELGAGLLITLVIIGLIVGLLNVTGDEVTPFLLSGVVLIIASAFGKEVLAPVPVLGTMLDALLVLFVPATIIVAIKNVFVIARK